MSVTDDHTATELMRKEAKKRGRNEEQHYEAWAERATDEF